MVDDSIITNVRHYLQSVTDHGVAVRFGVIFGSQAAGRANRWSDIDLLVVSPHFDQQRRRQDIDLLWRLAAHTDSRIEPIPCGERQWQEDDSSAVIEMARREGQRIALA
jgi:hypothetical protein